MALKVIIEQDQYPCNPREEFDHLGTMVCWHSRYILGDETETIDAGLRERMDALREEAFVFLPLYLYDHSGITISTTPFSCPWDSGQVGVIYVSRERALEEYGALLDGNREAAIACLIGEVEEYDQYLTGDVWTVRVEDAETGETVEGPVGGFFGHGHAEDEGNGMLAGALLDREREQRLAREAACRDIQTV